MTRDAATGRGERLVVGLVRGIHGLRGAVRVEVLTDDARRFDPGSVLYREGDDNPLTVTWRRDDAPGPGILVRFREVPTRTVAERLLDAYLEGDAAQAPPAGTYYWHDIVGTRVVTSDGEELGTVEDVFRAGEGDVFTVRGARGELLVPAVSAVVRELAPDQGPIVVDREALDLEAPVARRPRGRRSSKSPRANVPPR